MPHNLASIYCGTILSVVFGECFIGAKQHYIRISFLHNRYKEFYKNS